MQSDVCCVVGSYNSSEESIIYLIVPQIFNKDVNNFEDKVG